MADHRGTAGAHVETVVSGSAALLFVQRQGARDPSPSGRWAQDDNIGAGQAALRQDDDSSTRKPRRVTDGLLLEVLAQNFHQRIEAARQFPAQLVDRGLRQVFHVVLEGAQGLCNLALQ